MGSALVLTISAYSQNPVQKRQAPVENISVLMADRLASMNRIAEASQQTAVSSQVIAQTEEPVTSISQSRTNNAGAVNWTRFTGSMNMYGVMLPETKPLQYDDELNAVTFVHRKSPTYVPNPTPTSTGANTGVLVAMISTNWGSSWDSTMIYNDNNNWARYPQGGILKGGGPASASNTNIANALIAATAPVTTAGGSWAGNIFVTKSLGSGSYNNVQSQSSQTYIANTPPYTTWNGQSGKMDFVRESFQSTDDGKVRALGVITDAGPSTAVRGARMVTGSYVSGTTVWKTDSFIPPVRPNITSGGRLMAYPTGMAWSEDGQTGYVWFIGAHTSKAGDTTGANIGFQPVIARSNDYGNSWTWQSIDFNQPAFKSIVLDRTVPTAANPSLTVPYFNFWEGISGVVDSDRNLHLVSMIVRSPAANDPDSVGYYQKFVNYDGDTYFYPHVPGLRPYLYDFHGGSPSSPAYQVTLIDSLSTEGPSDKPAGDGYSQNPWAPSADEGNNKIPVDCRIQASRSVDGRYIIYSWAETDTVNTTNALGYTKWNSFPNIKARLMDTRTNCVSRTEINVSRLPDANGQTKMVNTSYNHYISQKCMEEQQASSVGLIVIRVPHTISFNTSFDPSAPAVHRYASVPLEFERPCFTDGIQPNAGFGLAGSYIFPNPASGKVYLNFEQQNKTDLKISILNMVGQEVKSLTSSTSAGSNTIGIDISGLATGIYLVNMTSEGSIHTHKLIVE